MFDGHFSLNEAGRLVLHFDGMQFRQTQPGKFTCYDDGCNAIIRLACIGEQVRINYENHSSDQAHAHSQIPARPILLDLAVDIPKRIPTYIRTVGVVFFEDEEFTHDAKDCQFSGVQIMEPGRNFKFVKKTSHGENSNGITRYNCSNYEISMCPAMAYKKPVNGVLKCKFVQNHNHAEPQVRPIFKPKINFAELDDSLFTIDLNKIPKTKPRKAKTATLNYSFEGNGFRYWLESKNLNAVNKLWTCSKIKSTDCTTRMVSREIDGVPRGYIYTKDHTCNTSKESKNEVTQSHMDVDEEEAGAIGMDIDTV